METVKTLDVTHNDLSWKIEYDKDRCTQCGSCTAACTFGAIEACVERRAKTSSSADFPEPIKHHAAEFVIKEVAGLDKRCLGCGMCEKVCPNRAIKPVRNQDTRYEIIGRDGGATIKRGGRGNLNVDNRTLDKILVGRISQMTDPSLDSERHTFDLLTPFGRILDPKELPLKVGKNGKLSALKRN